MSMRISDNYRHDLMNRSIQDTLAKVTEAQQKIATGRRFDRPSDSPMDSAISLQLRAERDDNDRYLRSLGDARSWLAVQDGVLQSASTLLARAEDLSVQARNAAMGPDSREAIAKELEGLREQLGLLANTTHQGQSVFGAHSQQAVQLTATSSTFLGTPGAEVTRTVAAGQNVAVNTDGAAVFGFTAGDDVFTVINRLASSVRSGDVATMNADSAALATRARDVRESLGQIGSRAALVESAIARHEDAQVTFASRLSIIEDTDIAAASVELARASRSYEAVLAMAARAQKLSLLDFLR
jgi:flagellar hook-associated protein 3 FlgL